MADFDLSQFADPVDRKAGEKQPDVDLSQYADPVQGQPASSGEARGAMLEAGGRGILQSGGAVGGAALGAMAGSPLGPPGALVGGAVGLVGGFMAGEKAAGAVGLRSPEQFPEELRPYAYAGESFGGSLPFAAVPFGMAATGATFGTSKVGTFLNQIINTAKTRPVTTLATELSMAASAATGAGVAESIRPGETGVRVGAEVAGGLLNPIRLTVGAYNLSAGIAQKGYQAISPAGRETAAARMLADVLAAGSEDPAILIRALEAADPALRGQLNAAQLTGSDGMIALERFLTKQSEKFGAESAKSAEDGLESMKAMFLLLRGTGDPAAVQAAAQVRTTYFRTLITGRVDKAKEEATALAARITDDTPDARSVLSVQARELIGQSISDVRAVETQLWNAVPKDIPVKFDSLQRQVGEILDQTPVGLKETAIPPGLRKFLDAISSPPPQAESLIILPENIGRSAAAEAVGTNMGEMYKWRSELLDMARSATDAGQFSQARRYSDLAESILDDIDVAFRESGDESYKAARSFSKEMNDVFTRSFVGRVTSTGRYGDRMAPELTLRRALASGAEAASVQLDDLREATRFLHTRGFADDSAYTEMVGLQERFVRLSASQAIDSTTGRANPDKIRDYINKNADLMNDFPEVRQVLNDAMKSEDGLRRLERTAKGQIDLIEKQKVFGRMVGRDPVAAARNALMTTDQEKRIGELVTMVQNRTGAIPGLDQREAMEGLRASIFDAAMKQSTQAGNFRPDRMANILFDPILPGRKPVIQILQEQGVITSTDARNIREVLEIGQNIVKSQGTTGTAIEIKPGMVDMLTSVLARATGSVVGTSASQAAGGSAHSLIVAGASARFAETITMKMPQQSSTQILMQAMTDPALMVKLLKKTNTMDVQQQAQHARLINAYLMQAGLTGMMDMTDAEQPEVIQ